MEPEEDVVYDSGPVPFGELLLISYEARIARLETKLRRVRDAIVYAATSPGGLCAEIDDILREE